MADLEGAAEHTLATLRELVAQVEAAHQKVAELGGTVTEAAAQVSGDWERLTEHVGAFLEAVQEQQQRLAAEVDEAGQAVVDAGNAISDARAQAEADLDAAESQTAAFAQQVTATEPSVAGFAESVDAIFQALSDQARQVEQQLEEAVGAARDFLLGEVVESAQELRQTIRDGGAETATAFEDCAKALQESYDFWTAGLDEVESTVEKAFGTVAQHLGENVDLALDGCAQAHTRSLDALVQQVATVTSALQEAARSTEECDAAHGTALGEHEGEMEATEAGLAATQAALSGVRAVLAQYTFVQV